MRVRVRGEYNIFLERRSGIDPYFFDTGEDEERPEKVRETDSGEGDEGRDTGKKMDNDIGDRKMADEHE